MKKKLNLFGNFDEKNFGVGELCVTRGTPFDQNCRAKNSFPKLKLSLIFWMMIQIGGAMRRFSGSYYFRSE